MSSCDVMTATPATKQAPIDITDSAVAKIWELLLDEGDPSLHLRAYVHGGGCSGFQYGLTFDTEVQEDDTVITLNVAGQANASIKVVVDAMSYAYLKGAKIDYQESVEGAQFVFSNPNAKTTCGCGSSFATEA